MKKRYILLIVIFVLLIVSVIALQLPRKIYTVNDFINIEDKPDGHYKLMNDLDFEDYEYFNGIPDFNGEFDGNGFSLININLEVTNASYETGVFLTNKGLIKNLTIDNLSVSIDYGVLDNQSLVGSVVGWNQGTISGVTVSNSYIHGEDGNLYVGGIVGENDTTGIIEMVYSDVDITFPIATNSTWSDRYIGGISGTNSGMIKDSMSSSKLVSSGTVAGIIGIQENGTIFNAYSNSIIEGSNIISGICGYYKGGEIKNVLSNTMLTLTMHKQTSNMNQIIGGADTGVTEVQSSVMFIDAEMIYKDVEGNTENKEVITNNPSYMYLYKSGLNESFFQDYLNFDPNIWNFTENQDSYSIILNN